MLEHAAACRESLSFRNLTSPINLNHPSKPALQDLDCLPQDDAAQTLLTAARDGTLEAVLSKKTGEDGRGKGGGLAARGRGWQ